jgi:hypothetical protein
LTTAVEESSAQKHPAFAYTRMRTPWNVHRWVYGPSKVFGSRGALLIVMVVQRVAMHKLDEQLARLLMT